MKTTILGHEVAAVLLVHHGLKRYYAQIDGKIDFDIMPAKYPAVILRRIRHAYANQWIHLQGK